MLNYVKLKKTSEYFKLGLKYGKLISQEFTPGPISIQLIERIKTAENKKFQEKMKSFSESSSESILN